MHVKSSWGVKSIQSLNGMLNGSNVFVIDTILQMKNLICDWKSKCEVKWGASSRWSFGRNSKWIAHRWSSCYLQNILEISIWWSTRWLTTILLINHDFRLSVKSCVNGNVKNSHQELIETIFSNASDIRVVWTKNKTENGFERKCLIYQGREGEIKIVQVMWIVNVQIERVQK